MAGLNRVLVVNAGSSTLKLEVLSADDEVVAEASADPWDGEDVAPIQQLIDDAGPIDATGHRVVHGGLDMRAATLIDEAVLARIEALTPLAPLHQPRAVAGLHAVRRVLPAVPAVACFDTAYHATLPSEASTYPLPEEWRRRWPLRRFGFHGISHAYAARRAADVLDRDPAGFNVVSCHLGAGSSLCASASGVSVDTTMGFTPLEGLVMQTRSGSLDPGVVLWLITEAGLAPDLVSEALTRRSGVAGLAGGTGDMRDVLSRRAGGDERAALAFDVYVHRLAQGIAAMGASLEAVDAVVFTGGVGEHAADVRSEAARRLSFFGLAIDDARNTSLTGRDADVSAPGARVATLVVKAREGLAIARETRAVLSRR